MKYDILYNHISPITGRLNLSKGYITIGDLKGISYESPILQYLKNDFLHLRQRVDELVYLDYGAINVGNKYNIATPIKLGVAVFPLPDVSAIGLKFINNIPIPNPTFNPASPMDWLMSGPWLPQTFVGSTDTDLSNPKAIVSSSLAMNQIRTAKNFKLFDNANFIVANKNVSFAWDNPTYLLANLSDNLKKVLELYDLGTSYTFTKAQSLGELETGLLKNTVDNGTGTLSKAISGEDYVNTADIPIGSLVIIDPLYPTIPNHKLIAPITDFKIRKNKDKEFGKEADKINVLDGIASTFSQLSITSIAAGSLLKISSDFNEIVPAISGIDYLKPNDIDNKLNQAIKIIKLLVGVEDAVNFLSITANQASNLNKIVKTIGGIDDTIKMVDVTLSDSKLLKVVKNVVGVKESTDIITTATKAADVFTNKAALVELEAQIAALAGVTTINTLWNLFNTVLIAGTSIGGYHYGQYIRGQSLNINNTWDSTDLNDEVANATGSIRPLSFTPYSYENRGHGTIWFDSNGRKQNNYNYKSEAGIRLFSWDSSLTDTFDSELSPLHIGLFGYRKYLTQPDEYKGFIFKTEFDNDKQSSIPGIINNPNYRFPIKFGLYDVHRTISSNLPNTNIRYGFNNKDTIFEYDYKNFNFNKPVKFLDKTAIKIPVGNNLERPTIAEVGMIRYNTDI